MAMAILGTIRSYRGETRQARKYLQDSLAQSQRDHSIPMQLVTLWSLAQLEEFEENVSKSEDYYRRLLTLWEKTRDIHDSLLGMFSAVSFFAARGLEKETALCADALAKMASITGNNEALATLAHALGEIALLPIISTP